MTASSAAEKTVPLSVMIAWVQMMRDEHFTDVSGKVLSPTPDALLAHLRRPSIEAYPPPVDDVTMRRLNELLDFLNVQSRKGWQTAVKEAIAALSLVPRAGLTTTNP
jgi:hypothetical protein